MPFRRIRPAESERLHRDGYCHVAVPPGIGDAYWATMKLRALAAREGRPLCVHINEDTAHATLPLLMMMPFIEQGVVSELAPYGLEGVPDYMSPKWATLAGSRGWNGMHYLFQPNGHLEQGHNIASWMPELETEWDVELRWTADDQHKAVDLMAAPAFLLYLSGEGPNRGFHNDTWSPANWAQLALFFNRAGHVPIAVGAPTDDDRAYWARCLVEFRQVGAEVRGLVGQTSIPDYLLLIKRARCWIGLNSGGGIVGASMGSPTLMLWADKRFPTGAAHPGFDPGFQRAWINPDDKTKNATYRTLSFGSPDLTPERAFQIAMEIGR